MIVEGPDAFGYKLNAWRSRPLNPHKYPFLVVDAIVVDTRRDEAVRSTGVLIAYGINAQGYREVLDLIVADSESYASWDELFKRLKSRGIRSTDLVVSDAHEGLVKALKKNFQGAMWQRCQVHFMRNILGAAPRQRRSSMASDLKLIFQAEDKATAVKLSQLFIEKNEKQAPKAIDCFERGFEDALSVLIMPLRYRRRLRTTNLAERMNEEIRRRTKSYQNIPQ